MKDEDRTFFITLLDPIFEKGSVLENLMKNERKEAALEYNKLINQLNDLSDSFVGLNETMRIVIERLDILEKEIKKYKKQKCKHYVNNANNVHYYGDEINDQEQT